MLNSVVRTQDRFSSNDFFLKVFCSQTASYVRTAHRIASLSQSFGLGLSDLNMTSTIPLNCHLLITLGTEDMAACTLRT